jgi:hypothetical protein
VHTAIPVFQQLPIHAWTWYSFEGGAGVGSGF